MSIVSILPSIPSISFPGFDLIDFGSDQLDGEPTGNSTDITPPLVPTTPALPTDDYPDGTSGSLAVGGNLSGDIETINDVDAFAVFLQAGETYQFDLRGAATSSGSLNDPFLQLQNSAGAFVAQDDDGGEGFDARIANFTPTSSGEFFLLVQSVWDDEIGTYTVSATQTGVPSTNPPTSGPTEPTAPEYVQTIILLYEAALNRNGNYDWDGVNFWIDRYESGTSYQTIARSFLNSPEFERNFGEPLVPSQGNFLNNNQFVNTMYQNVLDRGGDPGGLQYWNSVLQGGGNRESVLLNFARSPENFANNDDSLAAIYDASDGYWLI